MASTRTGLTASTLQREVQLQHIVKMDWLPSPGRELGFYDISSKMLFVKSGLMPLP